MFPAGVALRRVSEPYDWLRAAITEGRLQPNERLVEADLVRATGSSRTAVRTALVRLTQEGLVEHERNRGARVRMVGAEEAVEILQARAVLEALAARGAAERAGEEDVDALRAIIVEMRTRLDSGDLVGASERNAALHTRVLQLSGNATAQRLVRSLNSQLVRFQYRTILVPGRAERSYAEHSAIVAAVASGDADAAETAMRDHLRHVTDALRAAHS
jgi:DNA-binding GntR family transcriptional regulator